MRKNHNTFSYSKQQMFAVNVTEKLLASIPVPAFGIVTQRCVTNLNTPAKETRFFIPIYTKTVKLCIQNCSSWVNIQIRNRNYT